MEVAGQWRREWTGTAEYGKVTEGGVTRKVARAMEVLHASAPGARVRVLRAAYHSTAGPGAPASSYLLHSSRRVISSGYNFIEPDTSLIEPLEISSTPLESSPESEVEKENYKVTEPDDFEISEPSKWRGSKNINSIRMPSEESSSTDNTSVIDIDYNIKNARRKSSEQFTSHHAQKRASPVSSLLDAPVTLSTLKYKSLLNGSDSWNNRRKSYSFEETPEAEEASLRESDALTMESSTDSGICKSSEIVNEHSENSRYLERKTKMEDIHEDTFKDWLSKNRQTFYINQVKPKTEFTGGVERIEHNNNITVQSAGKVLITLPNLTKAVDYEPKNVHISDDSDRRTKKVEFCKTELHFAAESGTVNIIATDEKPPPSTDFRKKKSVFVPMTDIIDKPITLFGDKTDVFEVNKPDNSCFINDNKPADENTAATKSILKNKIPKPKPYLLGENMAFGYSSDLTVKEDDLNHSFTKPSRISLINRQLQSERRFSNESKSSIENELDWSSIQKLNTRTNKIGPVISTDSNHDIDQRLIKNLQNEKDPCTSIKSKVQMLKMSPTPVRPKTRQLRESDLTYFGVVKSDKTINESRKHSLDSTFNEKDENIFQSVKLVKLISSVCNSEVDSDEAPDYENLPIKSNFIPKPAPRSRSKCDTHLEDTKERDLKPIFERDIETVTVQSRRIKVRQQVTTPTARSISEPPKTSRQRAIATNSRAQSKINQAESPLLTRNNSNTKERRQKGKVSEVNVPEKRISISPLYVNLKETKKKSEEIIRNQNKEHSIQRKKTETKCDDIKANIKATDYKIISKTDKNLHSTVKRADSGKRRTNDQRCERKNYKENRTKILVTPEKSPSKSSETNYKKHKNVEKSSSEEKNAVNATSSTQKHRTSRKECQANSRDSTIVKKLQSGQDHKKIEASTLDANIIESSNIQKMRQKLPTDTKLASKEEINIHTKGIGSEGTVRKSSPVPKLAHKNENTLNKSKRSKYVINYDDKNGTVSSVCKIKPGHGFPRKKKIVDYENKDNLNHHSSKNNNASKKDLLQLPEQRMKKQR